MAWTKERQLIWRLKNKEKQAKQKKNKYKTDPIYRQKCIENAIRWQKKNKDKTKANKKKYYNKNIIKIKEYYNNYCHSEHGRKIRAKYWKENRNEILKGMMNYYFKNAKQWDKYRYKWILKNKDIHDINLRIAKLIIKRINQMTNYKLNIDKDIKMRSNGQADIMVRNIDIKYINKLKEEAVYWQHNFNDYVKSKVNVKIKSKDIKEKYKPIIIF